MRQWIDLFEKAIIANVDAEEITVQVNPSRSNLAAFMNNLEMPVSRGIIADKAYFWSAFEAYHYDVAEALGLIDKVKESRGICLILSTVHADLMTELDLPEGSFKVCQSGPFFIAVPNKFVEDPRFIKVFPGAQIVTETITESYDDPGQKRADNMMKRFGGKPKPFSALPPAAKKSVHHYMMVDGENDEYQTNLFYAYAEIPTDIFMHAYWANLIEQNPEDRDEYGTAEEMLQNYKSGDPSKSAGFGDYIFKNHDLKNPWPVILGSDFFEDGAHRLAHYVYSGLTKIPAVAFYPVPKKKK